jgi:hypothetical protein
MIRDALSHEPSKRPTAKQLLMGWDTALAAPTAASEAPTAVQSVVQAPAAEQQGKKRRGRIAAIALAGLLVLAAAFFGIQSALSGPDPTAAPTTSTTTETTRVTPTPTSTPTPTTATPTPTVTATSTPPVTPAALGSRTFNLTDIEYSKNDFYGLPSEATIATKPFPNSIKGSGHTTNTISFGIAGACTQLKVSVGQDAFSPNQGGPITFQILLNDVEAAAATVGPYEEAKELVVNLAGITNLKLVENRTAKDGYSVWGSPVVTCDYNPAPAN